MHDSTAGADFDFFGSQARLPRPVIEPELTEAERRAEIKARASVRRCRAIAQARREYCPVIGERRQRKGGGEYVTWRDVETGRFVSASKAVERRAAWETRQPELLEGAWT